MFLNVVTFGNKGADTEQHISSQEELADARREVRYRAAKLMFKGISLENKTKSIASRFLALPFLITHIGSKTIEESMSQTGVYHILTDIAKHRKISRHVRRAKNEGKNFIEFATGLLLSVTVAAADVLVPLALGGVECATDGICHGIKKGVKAIKNHGHTR